MRRNPDRAALIGLTLGLCSLGAIIVYSSTFTISVSRGLDESFYFSRHLQGIAAGLVAFLIIQGLDYSFLKRVVPLLTAAGLVSLVLVFHPALGVSHGGFRRWFNLGLFTVQPSEFCRFVLLGYFAFSLDRHGDFGRAGARAYLGPAIVWIIASLLILLEPNYSIFAEVGLLFLALLFVSGFPRAHFLSLVLLYGFSVALFLLTSTYRLDRFLAFLEPYYHYETSGYQVIQSLVGFANGGFLGAGIGAGKQKLLYLPEAYNDYIFSILGEELGFAGVCIVATAYLWILLLCLRISQRAPDKFGAIFCFGAGMLLTLSAFMHMSVCLNILPPTGVTLPFVSYGGSSMFASLAAIGVVCRISREWNPEQRMIRFSSAAASQRSVI